MFLNQNSNQQIAQLQAEVLNHQIIAKHHSQNIQDNLPAEEEAPTEEATTAKAPHPDTLVTE